MKQSELLLARMERVAARGMSLPIGHWGRALCASIYERLWARWQLAAAEERRGA